MTNIIQRSFSINLRAMQVIGLYPPEKHISLFKIYAYVLYFIALIPSPVLGFLYIFFDENIDIMEVSYSAPIFVDMAFFALKLLPFVRNGSRIKKCIHYFDSSVFAVNKEEQKKTVDKCVKICRRNSIAFFSAVFVSCFCYFTKPFLQDNKLPLNVWLPFDPASNIVIYSTVYVTLCIGVAYAGLSSAAVDPLIGGLSYHAAGQLRVLKDNMQRLSEYADEEISKKGLNIGSMETYEKSEVIYSKIKQCVNHHNSILTFFHEFEQCFSMTVFSQFLGSIFVIGFCCLHLSKLPFLMLNFFIMFSYFCVGLGQIYFYCYYGTLLLEESKTLSTAVYMGEWYEYDMKIKKALITLMEGSKKPMRATAGKVFELSLETFTMIMKSSYSLLAVLKNY